jgi:hypothetical protein
MSKKFFTVLASGLLLASAVVANGADPDYTTQGPVPVRNGVPQIQSPAQVRTNARRFYSYQPQAQRGQRPATIQTFVRPASAKANGEY